MKHHSSFCIFCCTIFLFLFVFISCQRRPDVVISKSKMEEVLYDYHLTQAMTDFLPGDSIGTNKAFIDAVFAKHNITQQQFDSSLVWYNAHASELKNIYDHLKDRFTADSRRLQLEVGENTFAAGISENGDTANLWNGPSVILLRDNYLQNQESFTLGNQDDTLCSPGDQFILTGEAIITTEQNNSRAQRILITVTCQCDSDHIVGEYQTLETSNKFNLTLQTKTTEKPNSITCTFQYQCDESVRNLCLLRHLRLIRIHNDMDETQTQSTTDSEPAADTLSDDSVEPYIRHREPRLTPQQLHHEAGAGRRQTIEILPAPKQRTPNSFGPSRRKK